MRASEVHDVGEALIDDEDIVGDWQRPSFDLASQSVGVLDNGTLIAFAEVFKGRYADATVHAPRPPWPWDWHSPRRVDPGAGAR